MSVPKWIEDELARAHVTFRERHHRPRFTAQEVAAEEHVSGHRMAKVVVVTADERLVEVVVPASQKLNLEAVRLGLGCNECRLTSEREIAARFEGCEVGAIPPLRHWPDIAILMDRHLSETIGPILFQAGTHEDAIEMDFGDWYRLARPQVGDFASQAS